MAFYKVVFAKRVRKDFRGFPQQDAEKILNVVRALAAEPYPGGSKKWKDEELIVMVVKVGYRKDVRY
ncbi:type II toxin-antitoxin system RelE/ParE family toxin [Rubritalea spongiae]|uniref:Type II toxin-antitoxin system RelE/ParE family toxin n=1 Tax=Rubritalea spongiae TaxID=430797 RepID=A0ABW5E4N2_9BACT